MFAVGSVLSNQTTARYISVWVSVVEKNKWLIGFIELCIKCRQCTFYDVAAVRIDQNFQSVGFDPDPLGAADSGLFSDTGYLIIR